jgi:SecD/SecF fusion protein
MVTTTKQGKTALKNIHTRRLLLIVVLLMGAIWAVLAKPTRLGLDIQGGIRVVLRAKAEELKSKQLEKGQLDTITNIMRHRVDALGVAEPVVYPKPPEQIVVELPGLTNKEQALAVIQTTARLEFRSVDKLDRGTWHTEAERNKNGELTGYEVILGPDGTPVPQAVLDEQVFSKAPVLSGDDLLPNTRVEISRRGYARGYAVAFEFRGDKKGAFENFTRTHYHKRLAMFLDKKLLSTPVIESAIPGKGVIRGGFTPEQAKTLSSQLNAGALPVPLEQVELRNVEATLGHEAVQRTLVAGSVGLASILLLMLWWYRLPGLLADIALALYTVFTFGLFKLIPVTLTVPGMAGLILSIGMAVDANILIFERFREERATGRALPACIEAGFKRAFSAIFDANVCTLITCAVLYQFGTGQVRGFALTLAIGVACSMFTAITCSRTFLLLLAGTNFGRSDAFYRLASGLHPRFNVTKRMGVWFGLSGLVIVPGLIFWLGLSGIKYGIEFTGGTEISAQFMKAPSVPQIEATLKSLGHQEARILLAEDNRAYITTKNLRPEEVKRVKEALQRNIAPFAQESVVDPQTRQTELHDVVSESQVSAVISQELTHNAFLSIVYASVLIILYLACRFSIPNFVEGLKFGTCAVIALLHDVLVVWGAFASFGYFRNWQIDNLFVTAMLTVIGFSVHDTIIIFDRMRENLRHKAHGESFAAVTDQSIEQTFSRSVRTSGTVVLTLLALLILGGPVIRLFVTALLIGIISGTYSSIFNASPLLVLWKQWTDKPAWAPATEGGPMRRPAVKWPAAPAPPHPTPTEMVTTDGTQRLTTKKRKYCR